MRAGGVPSEAAIADWLASAHGIRVETVEATHARAIMGNATARSTRPRRSSRFPAGLPPATRRFQLARLAFVARPGGAGRTARARPAPHLRRGARSGRRRRSTATARARWFFPYDRFLSAAETVRYDLERLAALFGASMEQVCHRLVTLRRPGAEGIPFAFLRVDPAGNISKRFSLPTLRLPRYGGACPLWAIYRTALSPGALVTQRVRLPDGREFLFIARMVAKPSPGFGAAGRDASAS